MAEIKLKNIVKEYPGKVIAVHNFNLDINNKEFVVLVGPSGCGKSTVLRMIAGLEEITSGELYIDGEKVNDVAPKDRDIAMVFQNYALYPHMTVYRNLAFALELRKTPKDEIEKKVKEAAKILDIEHLLDRKPRALSGGQRQRVALGRAMVRNPKVFLLDEPLSNLDAKLRASMRTEISRLHQKLGTTFIYVTHDQTEAMTMASRIVVIKDGYIQQIGKPQELYDNPCNIFVASFIGSPQMNLLPTALKKDDRGFYITIDDARFHLPEKANTKALLPYVGKEVVLGIRPEDVYDFVREGEPYFETFVEVSEHTGSETYLHIDHKGEKIVARVGATTEAASGKPVRITFDVSKMHLFDKDSEEALI